MLGTMRFSLWTSSSQSWSDMLAVARHAEATGWDGVWVADHFMANVPGPQPADTPTLEAGSLVAALGAAVPRLRIGTLVYGNTYRHPAVLANMAATVDHVTGGRFVLGMGTGWQVNEHEQYGIDLPPVGERVDRFEEAVQVVRSLLREPTTTFDGRHYRLTDARCEPKPVQAELPIWVGGQGERRTLRIAARWADAVNVPFVDEATFAHKREVLLAHCDDVGRDPGQLRTAVNLGLAWTEE
ncbi:MAG TPA: LLM class F420-dependent oxidoreductase, partial [Acidimicrobiales bacterium]